MVVRGEVLRMVAESTARVAPPELEKWLVEHHGLKKKEANKVLKKLVSEGELAYTYEFGTSFLELSFNRPVRVSTRVVLKPPGLHFKPEAEDVVITIKPGAAFGDGRHPTSRLAVRGIEYILKDSKAVWNENATRVLDIGTGSGILVLTAVRMGIHSGLGIDIDPSARAEAAENVSLNRLEDRVELCPLPIFASGQPIAFAGELSEIEKSPLAESVKPGSVPVTLPKYLCAGGLTML